jgi:hypothetical protein
MTTNLDLKQIEKRAFRSTYQDGLWDIYYGLIVIFMSIFIYRPESGYQALNIFLALAGIAISYFLFSAGKKYLTIPRLGQVVFGEMRRNKKKILAIILAGFVFVQVVLVVLTAVGWFSRMIAPFNDSLMIVSLLGSLIVGSGMLVSTYFSDFQRGYYISLLMALAVFCMIYLNKPLIPILIGLVIILPGLVLLFSFLKRYPLNRDEAHRE